MMTTVTIRIEVETSRGLGQYMYHMRSQRFNTITPGHTWSQVVTKVYYGHTKSHLVTGGQRGLIRSHLVTLGQRPSLWCNTVTPGSVWYCLLLILDNNSLTHLPPTNQQTIFPWHNITIRTIKPSFNFYIALFCLKADIVSQGLGVINLWGSW